MPFTDAGKNQMLDSLGTITASLHIADPGASGTSEVSGGSYARQTVTFSAASGGNLDSSNAPQFDVPGGTTVTHAGFWDSTTFIGYAAVTNESFGGDGTYTLTDVDLSLT